VLGRSRIGLAAALGIGAVLALGGLGVWYLDAPTSPEDCYECGEYWGRWMDATMFNTWLPMTLVLWTVGVFIGLRRRSNE
jgi:hypothetical protein